MTDISDEIYRAFLSGLIKGRQKQCAETVKGLLDYGISIRDLYINLFQRSLYEVGAMWEANRISVAEEHMATAIVENLFSLVYPVLFSTERIGKSAIISCVANEYHQVGGKIIADILELNGWDSVFLGANTPINDLMQMIDKTGPKFIGLSLAVYFNLPNLFNVVKRIRTRFGPVPILVGGQAFRWGGGKAFEAYMDIRLIENIHEFETALGEID